MMFGGVHNNSLFITFGENVDREYVIREYDGRTGEFLRLFTEIENPRSLVTVPNGNLLVTSGAREGELHEYNMLTGDLDAVFGSVSYPRDLALRANGNLLVASRDGDGVEDQILEFDLTTRSLVGDFVPIINSPTAMVIGGPRGNLFVLHGHPEDGEGSMISEYDGESGELIGEFIERGLVRTSGTLTFGPNGNLFVETGAIPDECGVAAGILEFDAETGELLGTFLTLPWSIRAGEIVFKPEMEPAFPPPQISSFSPGISSQCQALQGAVVSGSGLVPGARLALVREGESEIHGVATGHVPDTEITVAFDVAGARLGAWAVELRYPDGQSTIYQDAIQITGPCFPPTVSQFSPLTANNCESLEDAVANGTGFFPGATVKLTRTGERDIAGTDVEVTSTSISAKFWLYNAQPGLWDAVVTNPGDTGSGRLTGALEITVDKPCRFGRTGDLYVGNVERKNVLQYDGRTGEYIGQFVKTESGNLDYVQDLTWGPNGNLFVADYDSRTRTGDILEYDGKTGEFIRALISGANYQEDGQGFPKSTAFGGPRGNLYLLEAPAGCDQDSVREYDATTGEFVGTLIERLLDWGISGPHSLRFGPNGNLFVSQQSSFYPGLYEFDPATGDLIRVVVREIGNRRHGFVYEPTEHAWLLCEDNDNRVKRYDFETGNPLRVLVQGPENREPFGLRDPYDLAYGPTGNLFVVAQRTMNDHSSDNGAVHEYRANNGTYEEIQVFGYAQNERPTDDELQRPRTLEFKPLPGDYGGDHAGGDWDVDIEDYQKLHAHLRGPAVRVTDSRALIAFDRDHDRDLDLRDYAAFQVNFASEIE
jgi:WD40 repeat protein